MEKIHSHHANQPKTRPHMGKTHTATKPPKKPTVQERRQRLATPPHKEIRNTSRTQQNAVATISRTSLRPPHLSRFSHRNGLKILNHTTCKNTWQTEVPAMATSQSRWASTAITGLILLSLVVASAFAQGSQEQAASAIYEAEQAIVLGYEAVLAAEEAGGNVTGLLAGLNDAVALLVDARRAFNVSLFEEAISLAGSASAAGDTVRSAANTLEIQAAEAKATRTTRFLIASFVAVPLVLAVGLLGYRYVKKRHHQQLLKMKPEVEEA